MYHCKVTKNLPNNLILPEILLRFNGFLRNFAIV